MVPIKWPELFAAGETLNAAIIEWEGAIIDRSILLIVHVTSSSRLVCAGYRLWTDAVRVSVDARTSTSSFGPVLARLVVRLERAQLALELIDGAPLGRRVILGRSAHKWGVRYASRWRQKNISNMYYVMYE